MATGWRLYAPRAEPLTTLRSDAMQFRKISQELFGKNLLLIFRAKTRNLGTMRAYNLTVRFNTARWRHFAWLYLTTIPTERMWTRTKAARETRRSRVHNGLTVAPKGRQPQNVTYRTPPITLVITTRLHYFIMRLLSYFTGYLVGPVSCKATMTILRMSAKHTTTERIHQSETLNRASGSIICRCATTMSSAL